MGWLNDLRRDLVYCARSRRLREFPHAAGIRFQQRRAKVAGFRDGWQFYRGAGAEQSISKIQQA
jgi:rhamnosyltransferase